MVKHELLVPAGDMQCLLQAVANGADAVYVGCKNFGARRFAKNFDNNEIVQAIRTCHLYGVKIYATMNTLVKDDEVPYFLGQVEFLYRNGIDAIIVQDFGMMCLVRQKYPELEIHASTQANTSSKDAAELYHSIGVKRVVFSREMSLKEINDVKVPIEKEVFIHGALCISYSGNCLMSSMIGPRSGNRGECAGICRMPYALERNGRIAQKQKYLLSTKELNTAPRFRELLDSNIESFKIEGRMKSPEYVGFITKYYRNIIDTNGSYVLLEEDTEKLKTIFTREFTTGHLFDTPASELLNTETPNHIGQEIGKVIEVNDKKIKIKLTEPLNQQDGIRFLQSGKGFIVNFLYDETDNLVNSAYDICYVDNKVGLTEFETVCKTLDYNLMQSLQALPSRKVPVTFTVQAKLGQPLVIVISDGVNSFKAVGTPVQAAQTAPMDADRIREQIEKLGDTSFVSTSTIVNADDNIFIQVKELNDLRRTLTNSLMNKRMEPPTNIVVKNDPLEALVLKPKEKVISASIYNLEQQDACRRINLSRIYTSSENLYNSNKIYSYNYYKVPRCKRNPFDSLKLRNLVSDYFDFSRKEGEGLIGSYPLNVTNIYTMYFLYKQGIEILTPSVELTEEETLKMINLFKQTFQVEPNVEIFGYGRVENMVIKGNILGIEKDDYTYNLVDTKERKFPVYFDGQHTHILNYENRTLSNPKAFRDIASIRLDFYNEKEPDIRKAVKHIQDAI